MAPPIIDTGLRIPVCVYRLQFNYQFTFNDARSLVPYLHGLGISDIYSSPCFSARKGSLHGYEVVNPNSLNPELGTEDEYDNFVSELHKYGMGQILDIVPNHMCIECNDNAWWFDVLENGMSSPYSIFFDIDWKPVKKGLENKVLIPFLGDQYGNTLENQELQLTFDGGAFFITHNDHKFPIIPDTYAFILKHRIEDLQKQLPPDNPDLVELQSIITSLSHLPEYTEKDQEKINERYREKEVIKKRISKLFDGSAELRSFIKENLQIFNGTKGDHTSFDLLDILLGRQVWRLSHWRVANEEINYRRFFDINELGAIRMEYAAVFSEIHKLTFRLIREGKVTGLRVDHIDGLYNPSEYLDKLQKNCFVQKRKAASNEEFKSDNLSDRESSDREQGLFHTYEEMKSSDPQFKPFYVIGEKILTKGEKIPDEWRIHGTTGYTFLNSLNGIFIDTRNGKFFDSIYGNFIRSDINFQDVAYGKKKLVMQEAMSGEVNALAHRLNDISEKNRHTKDFTLNSLIKVITEVIACFPIYRTYISSLDIEGERQYIETAVSKAKRRNPAISRFIFDFLRDVLLLNIPEELNENDKYEWLDFTMKFQQITGPVMAKGLEDTAFYVFNRLVSLNEVGGSPDRFGTPLDAFHGQNIETSKSWPHTLITTSTHDTKRSEDVRARLNVLSEIPGQWKECLLKWGRYNKGNRKIIEGRPAPERNEEYLLYQTLLGAWPVSGMDKEEYDLFKNRIRDYMLKAVREAKVNTSWINPDTEYEDALMLFVEAVMNDTPENQFLSDFKIFQKTVSGYGMYNSLSQTLLKIASPGVPDFYQGTEIWDFSLVDPDNRRPVDYVARAAMLEKLRNLEAKSSLIRIARELTVSKEDGLIKLYLTWKALNHRKQNAEVFERGEYVPLDSGGSEADNVCSFARQLNDKTVLAAAPRFFTKLVSQHEELPFGKGVWKDSSVFLPSEKEGTRYRNIFTDEIVNTVSLNGKTGMYLSQVFANFPVALMEKITMG